MSKTIYAVTGAAGFLGNNVCIQLLEQGKKVRALVLNGDPAAKYVPEGVEIIYGDVTNTESMEPFFETPEGCDLIVIHSASIVTVSPEPNKKVYEVNVNGTKNIIKMCLKHEVKKLVYISSTGAITEIPGNQKIKEPTFFEPDKVIGYYSLTKAEATQLVLDAVKEKGLDASIVYPSGICGPNDYAYGPVAKFIIQYCKGEMPAGIAGNFNSVDVRDLAAGVIACTEKGRKSEGYIMSNDIVSMREMFDLISAASGTKRVKTILPISVAKVLAALSSIGTKITHKPAMLTSFAIYNMARNNNFDCRKAKKELGYQTCPFEKTISDSVKWLKQEGKI